MFDIAIANQQTSLPLDEGHIRRAVELALKDGGIERAAISVAVVDDPTIHDLNRQFLEHDYPTDVLSFLLGEEDGVIEGEVIVSADTAIAESRRIAEIHRTHWPAEGELLLYIVHGTLHLTGLDDATTDLRAEMFRRQRAILAQLGFDLPAEETAHGQLGPTAPHPLEDPPS